MSITMQQARQAASLSRETCGADGYGRQIVVWPDGETSTAQGYNDELAKGGGENGGWIYPLIRLSRPMRNGVRVLAAIDARADSHGLTPGDARDLRTRARLTQRQLADELAYGSGGQVLISQQETGVVGLSPSTAKLWRIVCERRIEAAD